MIAALFLRGPAWDEAAPIAGQSAFDGHLEWVATYRDAVGAPVIEVAPFHDPERVFTDEFVGLALLDVDALDDAREVIEADPMVGSAAFAYRLFKWGGEPLRRSP